MRASLPLAIAALFALSVPSPAAAASADPGAQMLETGMDYAYGRHGKKKDEARALECYEEAAAQGNAEAAYRAARMYFYGIGTKEDKDKARAWYSQAAAAGHEKASRELQQHFPGATRADMAPASMEGTRLVLDYRKAEVSQFSHETGDFQAPGAWEGDATVTYDFDQSTEPAFESGERYTYTKTGPDSAVVEVEAWEYSGKFTLHFETPTSGTATEESVQEADRWKTTGVRFRLEK